MSSGTVTSKGQVTVPAGVRTKLGLRPGSRLVFVLTSTGGCEMRPGVGAITDLKVAVTPPARSISIDEVQDAIAAGDRGLDFADAVIAEFGRVAGCKHTVTFDRRAARSGQMRLLASQAQ